MLVEKEIQCISMMLKCTQLNSVALTNTSVCMVKHVMRMLPA